MGERLNRAQAADQLGVKRQRIEELIKEGRLSEQYEAGAGHFIDGDELERLRGTLDVNKQASQQAAAAMGKPAADPQIEALQRQTNFAKTKSAILRVQEQELDLEEKRGNLVQYQLVARQAESAGLKLRQRMEAACTTLAPQVCVLKDQAEAHELLRRTLIEGVLADFAADISQAGRS